MTKQDRDLIDEKFNGIKNLIENNFNSLNREIAFIKDQTTQTNGRVGVLEKEVDELEKKEITHTINCPVAPRVGALEKENAKGETIRGFFKSSLGVGVMIFTGVWTIIKILEFFIIN